MTHVVQFGSMNDFLVDLDAGEVCGIYHDLIDQRVAAYEHGLSQWQLATIIRGLVAVGRVTHIAALTIPHLMPLEMIHGQVFGPGADAETKRDRWERGANRHAAIVAKLQDELAALGLLNFQRAGILNLPDNLSIIYAENPVEEKLEEAAA